MRLSSQLVARYGTYGFMAERYAHLRNEALRRASDLAGDILARIASGIASRDEQKKG